MKSHQLIVHSTRLITAATRTLTYKMPTVKYPMRVIVYALIFTLMLQFTITKVEKVKLLCPLQAPAKSEHVFF